MELKPLFVERMKKLLPDKKDFNNYLETLKTPPVKSMRCNTLKISPDKLKKKLEKKDWKIKNRGTWVLFDFPDITVIPENTYYIHKIISHGNYWGNSYGWSLGYNNQYPRGDAWIYAFVRMNLWITLKDLWGWNPDDIPDPDLCFITYYQEPKCRTYSHPFLLFFENHPYLFPIQRMLLHNEHG